MSLLISVDLSPENWPFESDWTPVVEEHLVNDQFRQLIQFIRKERQTTTVFPAAVDIFNAFRFCSFEQTKVVILGQDPYHGDGQANGLSFSVDHEQRLPPSLRNIFKELSTDIGCDNQTGDLTGWARQGVLLLNTVLTVRRSEANSHQKKGWEQFTDHVIRKLGQRKKPVVFILWGNQAIKKKVLIESHHVVVQSPHPSPLSAHRGFFGSRPFSKTNHALSEFGATAIDWTL